MKCRAVEGKASVHLPYCEHTLERPDILFKASIDAREIFFQLDNEFEEFWAEHVAPPKPDARISADGTLRSEIAVSRTQQRGYLYNMIKIAKPDAYGWASLGW